jgi:hypothetical protein
MNREREFRVVRVITSSYYKILLGCCSHRRALSSTLGLKKVEGVERAKPGEACGRESGNPTFLTGATRRRDASAETAVPTASTPSGSLAFTPTRHTKQRPGPLTNTNGSEGMSQTASSL